MRNQNKSLTERIYTLGKKAVYSSIAAAGIFMGSSYTAPRSLADGSRVTEEVTFDDGTTNDGITTKSYIAQDVDKWFFRNSRLEGEDFEGQYGYTRLSFDDKLCNLKTTNMSLELTVDKSAWGSDTDKIGLIFSGDPTQGNNGTYYEFVINASPSGLSGLNISRQSPGLNHSYVNGANGFVNKGGANTLAVIYNNNAEYTDGRARVISTGYNFFINDHKVPTSEIDPETGNTINYIGSLPPLEGFVGNTLTDSMGPGDPAFSSATYFDNFREEYDAGGGGALRERKILGKGGDVPIPHVPDRFLRGDSNMDGIVNIADPIHTLNYLFLNGVDPRCLDAADTNDDEAVDMSDSIYTLFHLFQGEKILPPNIGGPGMDLTGSDYNSPLPKCEGL